MLDLCKTLGLKVPLIVAPMAGGPSSVELVVASSKAGSLGSIGAAYLNPDAISDEVSKVRLGTSQPFAINLFIPHEILSVTESQVTHAIEATAAFRLEMSLPQPKVAPPFEENFDAQFEEVLRAGPAAFSFVFGLLPKEASAECRKRKIVTLGTATSLSEALELEASGVDAIVAQGFEAGGHRAIFDPVANDPEVSTLELVKTLSSKVKVPVVAAGGIMDRNDIAKMLRVGASAVQMGTAFLAVTEAGTSAPYRRALLKKRMTKTSRAYSGRLARGIINRFMEHMEGHGDAILPFPQQNVFTRDLRRASVMVESSDFLSLWSGTGEGELWQGPTADLIRRLFD